MGNRTTTPIEEAPVQMFTAAMEGTGESEKKVFPKIKAPLQMQVELKESKREILPEIKMQVKQIILPEAVQEPKAKPSTQMQLEQEPKAKTPTVMQLEQEPEAKPPLQIQLEQEMKMASTENQQQKKQVESLMEMRTV
jgi:hypothetical protein